MTSRFHCDRAQAAVRALREVARRGDCVSVTRGPDGRAWASAMSPDRSVLLEVRLEETYRDLLPPGGFVATAGDLGDRPAARPYPRPWDLGVREALDDLPVAGAREVTLGVAELLEMSRAAAYAAGQDDGRVLMTGVWALRGGGAYAADGHRLLVPLRVHEGDAPEPRAWLPAPLVRALSRLADRADGPAYARVLLPVPEDETPPTPAEAWGAAEWYGGRASFLLDERWASYVPPRQLLDASRHVCAALSDEASRKLQAAARHLEKTDAMRAAIQTSGTGDHARVILPEQVILDAPDDVALGDPVYVNPRYLADAVRAVGPVRELHVGGPLDPVHVVGDERVTLIMPMRP